MRAARVARGLGLRELAQQIGMSASSLSEFEHGKSRPGAERLAALSAALDVPVEEAKPGPVVPEFRHWREFAPLTVNAVSQAGLDLFVQRGFHGSTMRMIAEQCGMSVAGVYHYAESKHDLLIGLMRQAMAEMNARCAAADEEAGEPRDRLARLVEAMVRFHVQRLSWGYLATNEIRALEGEARAEMIRERVRVLRLFDAVVVDCRDGSELGGRAPDHVTARAIVTMCVAIMDWYQDAGSPPVDDVVDQYVALAFDMVYAERTLSQ
jgi:TetR/AcrR family transcriptional regulator, cholesterol catabolism regulator